ncbi:sce7725 family protein [Winslowiella sp. 2C04]|uniref:sce7725 family protein n=1 Tax=Winslowiella sp. 2C04 TaxID=3416179 RepID=UPI003CF3A0BD
MYFPILKGKEFELKALRELVDHLSPGNLYPVIEPLNIKKDYLIETIDKISPKGFIPLVVINPRQDEYETTVNSNISSDLKKGINVSQGSTFHPCIKIFDENDTNALSFASTFDESFAIYIEGTITSKMIPILQRAELVLLNPAKNTNHVVWNTLSKVVVFSDGFSKEERNLDYPAESDYDSLHLTYNQYHNAIGFGDYTILPEKFKKGGGPAYVITLHLSYIDNTRFNKVYVRHFSSYTNTQTQSNPGGKFKEALNLLVNHVNSNSHKFVHTEGLKGFYVYHQSNHYPGLGIPKKLSIKHHIESIYQY